MALLGANKRRGIFRLEIVVEKLQRSFTFTKGTSAWSFCDSGRMTENGELTYKQHVEVKKGHFSVLAIDSGNAKRYVLPLCYLHNPFFLRLLEKASDEFGFEHEGALCIPCGWNELESILGLDRLY